MVGIIKKAFQYFVNAVKIVVAFLRNRTREDVLVAVFVVLAIGVLVAGFGNNDWRPLTLIIALLFSLGMWRVLVDYYNRLPETYWEVTYLYKMKGGNIFGSCSRFVCCPGNLIKINAGIEIIKHDLEKKFNTSVDVIMVAAVKTLKKREFSLLERIQKGE